MMSFGSPGSCSIFFRRRLTCVSTLRSKLVAAQGALRMLDQRQQQIEFAGAQRHGDTVGTEQFAFVDVEGPALEPVALGFVLNGGWIARAIAPQHGANARDQLAAAERLG